ncbi:MAG: S8/S53 family peptidase [Bacteroidia bacterium]
MKKVYALILIFLISQELYSQNRYAVMLTDKNNSTYSLSNPSAYLSPRAINRRLQFGIAIDSSDLPVNATYLTAIQNTGAVILNTSRWLNEVTVDVSANPSALATINALPFVKQTKLASRTSNKTSSKFSFEMESLMQRQSQTQKVASSTAYYNYGNALNQIQMLHGDKLHDLGFRGDGKIIAMLDAGFYRVDSMTALDSLRAHNRIIATYDFVDHNSNVYDDHTHGSMCFSIIGANDPGNIVGTAPEASFLLYRSEDAATEKLIEEYNWATAAEAADSAGADIISSSLGYTRFDDSTMNHTYSDMDGRTAPISIAANIASRKGIVVVSSAGNEGNGQWHYISAPADADSILTIGAVDAAGAYASFSGTGPSADGRIKPTVVAQGQGTFVSDPYSNTVFSGNGTSFSCPVIAGLVASLWQAIPSANNMQIINAIVQSASQYSNPDSLLGFGIPNFDSARNSLLAVFNPYYGKGDFIEKIFPNPFKNQLNINFYADSNSQYTTEIFDLSGKRVMIKYGKFIPYTINSINLATASLGKSVYILRITTEKHVFQSRILKQ